MTERKRITFVGRDSREWVFLLMLGFCYLSNSIVLWICRIALCSWTCLALLGAAILGNHPNRYTFGKLSWRWC